MKQWIGILLGMILIGCAAEKNTQELVAEEITPQDETMAASDGMEEIDMNNKTGVTIDAQADVQDDLLTISYQVHNSLEQSIYLVNRVFKWDKAGFSVDPSIVYTQIVDGELWLTKANLDVPENLDVEYPDVPYLTKVEAGNTFEESFSLPLPLEPYHAYREVQRTDEAALFEQVKLVVGWLLGEEVTTRTTTQPEGLTLTSAHHADVKAAQQLLLADLQVSISAYIQETLH